MSIRKFNLQLKTETGKYTCSAGLWEFIETRILKVERNTQHTHQNLTSDHTHTQMNEKEKIYLGSITNCVET